MTLPHSQRCENHCLFYTAKGSCLYLTNALKNVFPKPVKPEEWENGEGCYISQTDRDLIACIGCMAYKVQPGFEQELDDNKKPGCFGAYGTHSCNIPGCEWFERCRNSRSDY